MLTRLKSHLPTILVAVTAAIVTAGVPPLAAAVFDAQNADKVDGHHAVGAGASKAQRAGKLVATDNGGYLPNNIIRKALDSKKLGGIKASAYRRRLARLVVVAKSGGDFTSVSAALNSINDASAGNRYLVYIAPGTYVGQVQLKPYVDVMGAGKNATTIRCQCAQPSNGNAVIGPATVHAASSVELSHLTVENTGGEDSAEALAGANLVDFVASDVRLDATANTYSWGGFFVNADVTLRDADVDLEGESGDVQNGVEAQGSGTLRISDSKIRAAGGSQNFGIRTSATTTVTRTEVSTSAVTNGTGMGVVVFGSSFTARDLDVNSAGSGDLYVGIQNTNGTVELSHSKIRAGGAFSAYSVLNLSGNSLTATLDVVASRLIANGSGFNLAINTSSIGGTANSQVTVLSSLLKASGGTGSMGVYSQAEGDVQVDASQVQGSTNTVYRSGGTVEIGASKMAGGPATGTSIKCVQVYDENYNAFETICP